MNTKYLFPVLVGGAFLAGSALSYGQQARVEVSREGQARRLTHVIKYKVLIQDDQPAGQVVDFVLSDGGCIDYIVANYEDRYYVIPYSAAAVRYDDSIVFVDLAPARFEQVQFFADDDWPDFYVPAFQKQVFSTFGVDVIRQDGRVGRRRNRDDNDRDRQGDRRDDKDRGRDRNRDGDDDQDGDRKKDLDDDKDSERPEAPDRDRPKVDPKPKADPKKPKSDPKAPKTPDISHPKPDVNPPKSDAKPKPNVPKDPASKAPAPKKPETPKTPEPK